MEILKPTLKFIWNYKGVQFSSVAQSCPTVCDPMNHTTPGLPVHHHLPEFTQTHLHRVCDAIQPSHPLSSPSPPAPNPSQHQSLFQWVSSSHEVAKVPDSKNNIKKKRPNWNTHISSFQNLLQNYGGQSICVVLA